jgi:hypothetical protein
MYLREGWISREAREEARAHVPDHLGLVQVHRLEQIPLGRIDGVVGHPELPNVVLHLLLVAQDLHRHRVQEGQEAVVQRDLVPQQLLQLLHLEDALAQVQRLVAEPLDAALHVAELVLLLPHLVL